MEIDTTRFGRISIGSEQILCFPEGLPGLEDFQQWVVIADRKVKHMAWLQSVTEPAVALPVIRPRDLSPKQRVRVHRGDVASLGIRDPSDCWVAFVVNKDTAGLRANLRAPIIVNRQLRLGRQVIAKDDAMLHDFVSIAPQARRRAA